MCGSWVRWYLVGAYECNIEPTIFEWANIWAYSHGTVGWAFQYWRVMNAISVVRGGT